MTFEIAFQADPPYRSFEQSVTHTARTVLKSERATPGALSIVLTVDQVLQDANRQFAGFDAPTDVLSFPDGEEMPDADGVYHGDILISVPYAERQAASRGHTLTDELCLLTVHGILHLLGYDHEQDAEEAIMWRRQREMLELLNIDPSVGEGAA